jgi:hypothetical protein
MRFFRSKWLQRILLFLLLVLLNAVSFDFIEQQGGGTDELVIHVARFHAKLSSPIQQPQIKCKFDAVQVSVVTIFKKIISEDYIPGTSFDPLSIDLLTYPPRGPPRLITFL